MHIRAGANSETLARARVENGDAFREDLARAKVELRRADSLRQQALVALASAIGDPNLSLKSLAGTLDVMQAWAEIGTFTSSR